MLLSHPLGHRLIRRLQFRPTLPTLTQRLNFRSDAWLESIRMPRSTPRRTLQLERILLRSAIALRSTAILARRPAIALPSVRCAVLRFRLLRPHLIPLLENLSAMRNVLVSVTGAWPGHDQR